MTNKSSGVSQSEIIEVLSGRERVNAVDDTEKVKGTQELTSHCVSFVWRTLYELYGNMEESGNL